MAKKDANPFECTACGAQSPKWAGRCPSCGGWNTLEERTAALTPKGRSRPASARQISLVPLRGKAEPPPRIVTGIGELDRVLGGGAVPGSAVLIAGDPGVGKSTLLMQAAASLAARGVSIAYVSGEESVDQVRLRARRLGLAEAPVMLDSATDADAVADLLLGRDPPAVLVVDSIQTMRCSASEGIPGTVGQVRASAQVLIEAAKAAGTVLVLVGHVTKDGQIAGPRVLEHMQDVVLFVESERGVPFRILRAVKNRFGATDEIGVFEMGDAGLTEVSNPSAAFLSSRRQGVPGSAVFAGMEGTRPLLVEIQALVAPAPFGSPRRTVVGYDSGRVAMIMAILESLGGVAVGANDLYVNVAGGLRIDEPAADLAVAAAILSAVGKIPCPADGVFFGELGLTGEVRAVNRTEPRLREAAKLGFARALAPPQRGATAITVHAVEDVLSLVALFHTRERSGRAA